MFQGNKDRVIARSWNIVERDVIHVPSTKQC